LEAIRIVLAGWSGRNERNEMNIQNPFAGMEMHVIRADGEEHEFTVSDNQVEREKQVEDARAFLSDHVKIIKVGDDV
jgi:hypothetical protein